MREAFDELEKRDQRVSIKHILSEPDSAWKGDTGRVTEAMVENVSQMSSFVFLCGPAIFNLITAQFLQARNIETHCFQG